MQSSANLNWGRHFQCNIPTEAFRMSYFMSLFQGTLRCLRARHHVVHTKHRMQDLLSSQSSSLWCSRPRVTRSCAALFAGYTCHSMVSQQTAAPTARNCKKVISNCASHTAKIGRKSHSAPISGSSENNSATGTRTRVAWVRAEYPNQLDYSGHSLSA